MYDVISLSVSCRRGISDLNCSECTTSFACGAMYEVSHESSQITVLNGPCLFACVLSLKCVWGLRLEFYFSNCLFIHLCESNFYYCLLIMHHQFVLCAQRRFVYIICYMLLTPIGAKVPIMACWRAGELCGLDAHASPAHPGAVTRFCGCIFIPSVLNAPHLFHAALCQKWHMRLPNSPVFKGGDCHINPNCYIVNRNPVLLASCYFC